MMHLKVTDGLKDFGHPIGAYFNEIHRTYFLESCQEHRGVRFEGINFTGICQTEILEPLVEIFGCKESELRGWRVKLSRDGCSVTLYAVDVGPWYEIVIPDDLTSITYLTLAVA
jgi:hypothetical protein